MVTWWVALAAVGAETETFHPLRSEAAEASSHLKSNWNKFEENYHPTYVLDENPATAWVEGVDGDGVGEWLELPLSHVNRADALRLEIRNGYQKSSTLLTANAAPKDVTIEVRMGDRVVTSTKQVLERRMGWQDVVIPLDGRGFDAVRIRIDSVTPGRSYKDTCISDVLVEVASQVPYVPQVETAKLQVAKGWIAQRVALAKAYATGNATGPFAAPDYACDNAAVAVSAEEVGRVIADSGLPPIRDQLAAATGPKYRADPTLTYVAPEGLWDFEAVMPLLRTNLFALLEGTKGRYDAPQNDVQKVLWSGRQWSTMAIAGPVTAPTAGYATTHEVFHERGITTRDTAFTFTWVDGKLSKMLVGARDVEDESSQLEPGSPPPPLEQGGFDTLVSLRWDGDKIVGWDGWTKGVMTDECDGADCAYTRRWTCRAR